MKMRREKCTFQTSPEAASLKKQAQHKVFTLQIKAFFPLIINIYSNASFFEQIAREELAQIILSFS